MEKYLEKSIISIINQSFQKFEIIIVNDNSYDNTHSIIQILQSKDKRIKAINHKRNLGVYQSRRDALLNSEGKYILYIDPDDMLLNQDLFEELYKYNLKYNLDIIEFSVYYQEEGKSRIFFPKSHEYNHYHKYNKNIIFQPELSNVLFYLPNTLNYTYIFCRSIWNKLIRKKILIKSIEYIENIFHNLYLIAADDTPINILNFNYAYNYSNINLPGYLYNERKKSISRLKNDKKHDIIVSYNYLLYLRVFYKYIIDFKKNINFFFYDLQKCYSFLLNLKDLNSEYKQKSIEFFNELINNNISQNFINLIKELIIYLNK